MAKYSEMRSESRSSAPLFLPQLLGQETAVSPSLTSVAALSPRRGAYVSKHVEDQYNHLMGYYSSVTTANATMTKLSQTTEGFSRLFQRFLNFEYFTLNQRSSKLEDHEITVMQKVFLALLQNPAHHLGAIHLYIEEILGIKYIQPQDKEQALDAAINSKVIMLQDVFHSRNRPIPSLIRITQETALQSPSKRLPLISHQLDVPYFQPHAVLPYSGSNDDSPIPGPIIRPSIANPIASIAPADPTLARMLSIYEYDKMEFENPSGMTKPEAAKLLRDTTENLIQYLHSYPNAKPRPLPRDKTVEIEKTLQQATDAALTVYGKRKWERQAAYARNISLHPSRQDDINLARSRSPVRERRREPERSGRDARKEHHRVWYNGRDTYRPSAWQS